LLLANLPFQCWIKSQTISSNNSQLLGNVFLFVRKHIHVGIAFIFVCERMRSFNQRIRLSLSSSFIPLLTTTSDWSIPSFCLQTQSALEAANNANRDLKRRLKSVKEQIVTMVGERADLQAELTDISRQNSSLRQERLLSASQVGAPRINSPSFHVEIRGWGGWANNFLEFPAAF
jgi:hypothetical protein